MKNILISSSFSEIKAVVPEFINRPLKGLKVAFIPIASLVETVDFYVEAAREVFREYEMTIVNIHLDEMTTEDAVQMIRDCDVIYVSGGNTFYLSQELRHSGLNKVIQEEVLQGKPYIGESAGAIILAPSIHYVELMDEKSAAPFLADDEGLHLIESYPLPHVGEIPFAEVAQQIVGLYEHQLPLILMDNEQYQIIH